MSAINLEYFDTHAHIHLPGYKLDADEVWLSAQAAGVTRMLAVGCSLSDSQGAVQFAAKYDGIWAAIGIHPHEAEDFLAAQGAKEAFEALLKSAKNSKIVAIGEIGLDYYYQHSPKEKQVELLKWQLQLAETYNLPVIFHVRDAFADFWPIFDEFDIKRGLIHSFTGVPSDVDQILKRGLYVALNGIMTFTSQVDQLTAAKNIPLDKLVLETDAPYLTPVPHRGKICKPEHVKLTAAFLAELRREPLEQLAYQTTQNARALFNVK
ncbi:MAG: TatD family hydrolase [Candidatus Saccharimonadales bacterium]